MEIKQIIKNREKEYFIQDEEIQILSIYEKFNICKIMYNKSKLMVYVDACEINKNKKNEKYISFHRFGGIK